MLRQGRLSMTFELDYTHQSTIKNTGFVDYADIFQQPNLFLSFTLYVLWDSKLWKHSPAMSIALPSPSL